MSNFEKLSDNLYVYRLDFQRLYREDDINGFRNEIINLAKEVPGLKVAVDFGKVEVASSMALGALVGMRKVVKDADGMLVIFKASDSIEKVLRVMQLDNLFELYPDEKAAVDALSA